MNLRIFPSKKPLVMAVAFLLGALTLPDAAFAKPDKKSGSSGQSKKSKSKKNKNRQSEVRHTVDRHRGDQHDDQSHNDDRREDHRGHQHDQARSHYHSRPRSTFSLNLGTGYAGRGYYYGPPNSPYYYQRPEVQYYRTRESAPRQYWGQEESRMSVEASVQQALATRGYYEGPVDGQLGPYSRRVIAQYQADQGMRPTGTVTDSLLRSLGLE